MSTREARQRLGVGTKRHLRGLTPVLALAYQRKRGRPGTWYRRDYLGAEKYTFRRLGQADDQVEADGVTVLSFEQAQAKALEGRSLPSAVYTVRDAIERYISNRRSHGTKALSTIETRARLHIMPELGSLDINDAARFNVSVLNRWRDALVLQPGSYRGGKPKRVADPQSRRATVNKIRTTLISALRLAHEEGHIQTDAAWAHFKPFQDADNKREEYLNVNQMRKLIAHCDVAGGFRDLVIAACSTGARFGELARLRVEDLIIDRAGARLNIKPGKTKYARVVDLSPEGREFFSRLKPRAIDGLLLPNRRTNRGWLKSEQIRPFVAAAKEAGLEGVSFHSLRHSYASELASKGVPLLVIASLLGHRSLSMVQRYAHLAPSVAATAVMQHAPRLAPATDRLSAR